MDELVARSSDPQLGLCVAQHDLPPVQNHGKLLIKCNNRGATTESMLFPLQELRGNVTGPGWLVHVSTAGTSLKGQPPFMGASQQVLCVAPEKLSGEG